MRTQSQHSVRAGIAALIAVGGLAIAGAVAFWVAGSLGISTAAASQIVAAIEVGGWAVVAIGAVFGAGIVGAVAASIRYLLARKAKSLVIA